MVNSFRWLAPLLSRRKHGPISKMPNGLDQMRSRRRSSVYRFGASMGRRQRPSSSQKTCSRSGWPCSMPILRSDSEVMMSGVTTRTNPAAGARSLSTCSSSTSCGARRPSRSSFRRRRPSLDEVALEALEGGVARLRVGEESVEDERVGAELTQTLRLRRREADAESLGFVGCHGDSSSFASGTRAR